MARALGLGYLDTGAMYRALTWWCLDEGIDLDDLGPWRRPPALPLTMGTDPSRPSVQVGGRESTRRSGAPDLRVGLAGRHQPRGPRRAAAAPARPHRRLLRPPSAGSWPRAATSPPSWRRTPTSAILLIASEEARLARRAKELHGEAHADAVDATRDQIVRRDRDDSSVSQFMQAAPGVDTVDTSDLDFEQSVQAVLDVVATRTGRVRA